MAPVPVPIPLMTPPCPAAEVVAHICTGSGDTPWAAPCSNSGGELGETASVKFSSLAAKTGTIDVSGRGIETVHCVNMTFEESRQTLTADQNDSGHTFGISSLRSEQQELVRVLWEARGAASANLADIIPEVQDSGLPYESGNLVGGGGDGGGGGGGSGG